jgi:hypothetical protein
MLNPQLLDHLETFAAACEDEEGGSDCDESEEDAVTELQSPRSRSVQHARMDQERGGGDNDDDAGMVSPAGTFKCVLSQKANQSVACFISLLLGLVVVLMVLGVVTLVPLFILIERATSLEFHLERVRSSAPCASVGLLLSVQVLLAFLFASKLGPFKMVRSASSFLARRERILRWTEDPEIRQHGKCATMLPCTDRVVWCRQNLSRLLGSIGLPPLTPVAWAPEHSLAAGASSMDQTWLVAVERLARHHVALIRRVDDLLEWIKDSTALGFFGIGGAFPSSSSLTRRGAIQFFAPSVELVERSAAARLLHQLNRRDAEASVHQEPIHSLQADGHPPAHAFRARSLPLARLRRNVAIVMLRQIHALSGRIQDDEYIEDEKSGCETSLGEATSAASWWCGDDDDPCLPTVITLSWLRSLRNDLARALFHAVDVSFSCSRTLRKSSLDAREVNSMKGNVPSTLSNLAAIGNHPLSQTMLGATALAKEALAYLEHYPQINLHSSAEASSKTSTDTDSYYEDVLRGVLQPRSLALLTASLALNESLFSLFRNGCDRVAAGDECQAWWTTLQDLSRQLSHDVESLGAALQLREGRHRTPSQHDGLCCDDDGDDSQGQQRRGDSDKEYVLINPSDDVELLPLPNRVPDGRSKSQQVSSTLVYSGQGSVVRAAASSSRGGTPTSATQDPATHGASFELYQCLIQELQGRLDLVRQEEVDVTSFMDSTVPTEGHDETNQDESIPVRTPGKDELPEPSAGIGPFSAMLLSELRGALLATPSSGVDVAESIFGATTF